jgi:hypothetical protein
MLGGGELPADGEELHPTNIKATKAKMFTNFI